MPLRNTDTLLRRSVLTYKALADETRLRIVNVLLQLGELCVCDIEVGLGITQSKASRHLAVLRQGGLVVDRREGTWIYYRVPEVQSPGQAAVCAAVGDTYGKTREGKQDVARTRKRRRCC